MRDDSEKTPTRPKKRTRGSEEAEAKAFLEMTEAALGLATHRQAQMTFSKSVWLNTMFTSMCILAVQFIVTEVKSLKAMLGLALPKHSLSDVLGVRRFVTEELLGGVEPTQIWRSNLTASGVRTWLVMVPSSLKLRDTRLRSGLVSLTEGLGLIVRGVNPVPSNRIAVTWSPVFPFTDLEACARAIKAQLQGVVSVEGAAIESEGNTLLGFARANLVVDLDMVEDEDVVTKLSLKDFSMKFKLEGVTYSLSTTHPCAVCGEDDHHTKKCPYIPLLETSEPFRWVQHGVTTVVPPRPMCPVNVIVGSSKQQEAGPSKAKKPKRVRKKAAKAKAGASEPANVEGKSQARITEVASGAAKDGEE